MKDVNARGYSVLGLLIVQKPVYFSAWEKGGEGHVDTYGPMFGLTSTESNS